MDNNNNKPKKTDKEVQEQVIDKLLCGYVEQIKVGSKTWISIAILSVYAMSMSSITKETNVSLPFFNVSLSKELSIVIVVGLIAALVTRWVEAQSRAIKTRRDLVEPILKELEKIPNKVISPKELWDARVFPGTATVWSAPASFVQSKHKIVKFLCVRYFILLKIISLSVHFGLPSVAVAFLIIDWFFGDHNKLMTIFVMFFAATAVLQLVVGFVVEFQYSRKALKRMKELADKPAAPCS